MKNTLLNFSLSMAALALLTAGIVTGCDKKDNVAEVGQTAGQKVQRARDAKDYIREDQLEDMLLNACNLADPAKEYVLVKQVPDLPGMYDIAILSLEYNPIPGGQSQEKPVCSGTLSWTLVKCMKDYIMANGCGMVTYSSGTWSLDPCPG